MHPLLALFLHAMYAQSQGGRGALTSGGQGQGMASPGGMLVRREDLPAAESETPPARVIPPTPSIKHLVGYSGEVTMRREK